MATPLSSPMQPHQRDQAGMAIVRGRDKRRHLSASAIDLRDPFALISLAVRFDEIRQIEAFLEIPLESGSLYDTHRFVEALEFLQQRTKASFMRSEQSQFLENDLSFDAITPVILSGVLATIQNQRELLAKDSHSIDISSELVNACQAMRRAALSRLRMKKKWRRTQRVIIPSFCVFVLFLVYVQSLIEMKDLVAKVGLVDSCNEASLDIVADSSTKEYYHKVCHISEAALWDQYKAYMLVLDGSCSAGEGNCDHSMLDGNYREAPFSMHSTLSRELITLEELSLSGVSSFMANISRHSGKIKKTTNDSAGISWLGDTAVNRLVIQALRKYLPPDRDNILLDVGCSVGGTLYPFLFSHTSMGGTNRSFHYHGISLGGTEIEFARRLAAYHDISSNLATFEHINFDAALSSNNTYSVMLAIESLSYSPNIEKTLSTLMKSLQSGGIFIIIDDVVVTGQHELNSAVELHSQASLLSHTFWTAAFDTVGCKLELARDLSLEYEVLAQANLHPFAIYWPYRIPSLWASKSSATFRVVTLAADLFAVSKRKARRREGFTRTDLAYNMYICRKP